MSLIAPTDPDLAHWLRLTLIPGIGGERGRALLQAFGPPSQIFSASRAALSEVAGDRLANALLEHDCQAEIDRALAWASEPGQCIVTLADAGYPPRLLETPDPPILLYVKGRAEFTARPALAIVGSRNCTAQGAANAEAFAQALGAAGLTIVSGLALGIDTHAHRGGLREAGSTVAVIGTGADRIYPARNAELAREIAAQGAIVSEFPLGTPALGANFPRRNRIIAGLALGVLVVEAAPGSGSLITARLAGEIGREVFAIPGSIHSPLSKGCHRLIRQGAKLVESAQDVLEELAHVAPAATTAPPQAAATGGDAHGVLTAIGHDPVGYDTIARRSGLTPDALYAILLELELAGRVEKLPGGRYQRIR